MKTQPNYERRRFFRVNCTLPIQFRQIQPRPSARREAPGRERLNTQDLLEVVCQPTYYGVTNNLSAGGLSMATQSVWRSGDHLRMTIHLPVGPVEVEGIVCRVGEQAGGFGRMQRVNLRFHKVPQAVQNELVRFVFKEEAKAIRQMKERHYYPMETLSAENR